MRSSCKIFLERGKVGGKYVWCYIKVPTIKVPLYLNPRKGEKINPQKYGEIILSGWGKNPPPEIEKSVKSKY
ncbi:hypothetical protein H1Q59_02585 [Holosporaceae bacterium 'Namur']|nr:hypothetical protein [Holosporaceae bacterium 'Namur']